MYLTHYKLLNGLDPSFVSVLLHSEWGFSQIGVKLVDYYRLWEADINNLEDAEGL